MNTTHNCLYQMDMDWNWGLSLSAKPWTRSLHQSKPSLLIDEMEILATILQVHFEDWKKYLAWYLVQRGLQPFLAPRTGFMKDSFFTGGGRGGVVSGWFTHITFIVCLISIMITSAPPRIARHLILEVGGSWVKPISLYKAFSWFLLGTWSSVTHLFEDSKECLKDQVSSNSYLITQAEKKSRSLV